MVISYGFLVFPRKEGWRLENEEKKGMFGSKVCKCTDRVFDKTLFRIFAKHETRENAPVFCEFREFGKIKFTRFSCFAKVIIFPKLAKLD